MSTSRDAIDWMGMIALAGAVGLLVWQLIDFFDDTEHTQAEQKQEIVINPRISQMCTDESIEATIAHGKQYQEIAQALIKAPSSEPAIVLSATKLSMDARANVDRLVGLCSLYQIMLGDRS